MGEQPIISVEHISKSFGVVHALNDVHLKIMPGEIRGLIGENGSGKSTLASIISGNLDKDSGTMKFCGEDYNPKDSFEAAEKGVAIVVQEQGTIETITAAANIFAGRENKFCKAGFLDSKKLNAEAQELLNRVNAGNIQATSMVMDLAFEDRKLVELARAFYKMPSLFIVDETTTALPQKGRETLYKLINDVKAAGKSVLFISHDIEELVRVCDTVSILRDGVLTAELEKEEMIPHKMKSLMVGREILDNYYRENEDPSPASDEIVLKADNVCFGMLKNISLELRKGEILGIAGLSDCGMHDLAKVLFGLIQTESGKVCAGNGKVIKNSTEAIKNKIGFISKNRDQESMLITMTIRENVVSASLDKIRRGKFMIFPKDEKKLAEKWCNALNVKMSDTSQICSELSGGNKQKVVLAKWLANESEVLIMDCPTRGIDVGVKEAIYRKMEELKAEGRSMIVISEELPEVIGMSDRLLVMKDGEIKKEFFRADGFSENDIIQYMI